MGAMRVLLVNDRPLEGGWGAENYVRRLADGLRACGDTVDIFAGEVVHHGAAKALDLWDPWARRLLTQRAAEFRPDVIHHHNVLRELSPSVLTAAADVPAVLTVHDLRLAGGLDHAPRDPRAFPAVVKSRLDRWVARRRVDAVLAVSSPVAAALTAAGFTDVQVVRVPAELPATPPGDVGACTDIVFAGRLGADKGVDVLVDAFARLVDDHPQSNLLIAGAGDEEERLRRRAAALGERVRFLGRLGPAQLSGVLGQARVVVVPSVPKKRREGSPLAVVEAAMHGRPVVTSDDPGLIALVDDLDCGVSTRAGSADALAAAIASLLDDAVAAGRYGAAGAAAATRMHSVSAVTDAVRSVYAGLLGIAA
jgi:glycosyltransferase involved in cell wall biosynthesis